MRSRSRPAESYVSADPLGWRRSLPPRAIGKFQDEPDSVPVPERTAPLANAGRSLANKNGKITLKSICYAFLSDLENKRILKYKKKRGICCVGYYFSLIVKNFSRQNLPELANHLYHHNNTSSKSARIVLATCQKGNHLTLQAGIEAKLPKNDQESINILKRKYF